MQENLKQVKFAKTLNIIVICSLLVLFTASIILAVIAPVFTCNVASAIDVTLPDNAVVGKNLIIDSDFSGSLWYKNTSRPSAYFSSSPGSLSFGIDAESQFTGQQLVRYNQNTSLPAGSYTVSFYLSSLSSSCRFRVISGGKNLFTFTVSSFGVNSFPFTLDSSISSFSFAFLNNSTALSVVCNWIKLEEGSFTGYVPDYQNKIDDLQTKYDDLQTKYDDFVSDSNFSYLNTVSLENAYYFNQNVPERSGGSSYTFGPNASDNSLPQSERDFTCPVNYFYSNQLHRPYLFGFQLPYVVPAGSTIKLNYTAFCVGASFTGVPFSELWRLGYTYAFFFGEYGYPTIDDSGQMLVVNSFNNANGDIYVKVNQPTSYVAFDVVSRVNYSSRLTGYFSISSSGVFSLTNDSSAGQQWILAFNKLNAYYQGDMLSAAVDSAKKDGYNKGYQEGKVAGREVGYQEGIKDNGDYTFMGLLGAVFDAPIQAFKGLFSFEVLGVNMTAFVSSLFGLAVILLIIKLILGGK